MYSFLSVTKFSISTFWRAENAILLIRQWVFLSQWFRYTCCGIRNICKYHLFLIVNSDYLSSNTRILHLMCCISMSNDEGLIYLLVPWVLNIVHFRHFCDLKKRFLLIRQRVISVNVFGYNCDGIRNICKYHIFLNVTSDS